MIFLWATGKGFEAQVFTKKVVKLRIFDILKIQLRPLQFNNLYENAGLWDSKSRTWEQTFEIDKRQLQRFGVHKITRFLFSRPRAFETYNLSKFHWLSTLVGFSLLFEQHSLFLFQKTRMLLNMKKAAWNLSLQSLRSFETIILYICK